MSLPFDLAGARSKNRFRNEMLWGLKKMLDLYNQEKNFTMVFDYSCDIEIHKEDSLEFYQVKTQNNNDAYKVKKLTTPNRVGDSILGKLYRLKFTKDFVELDDTVLGLVSNAPLDDGKTVHSTIEKLSLGEIDSDAVENIKLKLKTELNLGNDINLINTNFERTGINLIQPDESLVGEIVFFFERTYDSEPKKVAMLFRILKQEIENKASYEFELAEYEELLSKKGINKGFLSNLFHKYIDNTDIALEKAKNFIQDKYHSNYKKRISLMRSLTHILGQLNSHNVILKQLEEKAMRWFINRLDDLPDEEAGIIQVISESLCEEKTVEITIYDIEALVILVMKKFEVGVYGE
jgi:hypothetical protein